MKYITDDKKLMKASEVVEELIAWYGQQAFDRSGWLTYDEQVYAINQMIDHLKGLKDMYEGVPNMYYDLIE